MAGNGPGGDGSGSGRGGAGTGASISAAAAAMGSRRRWGGCFGGLSCFGSQGRAKRVVPSSTRVVEGNGPRNRGNGPQAPAPSIQTAAIAPSLLAPPSSPASFTHSAVPSTAQSPSCFLSISGSSPGGGPSATMLPPAPTPTRPARVPPVFSTFTTEPSTAPLTPPPELAHLTTPSSPDVPYARFLSSSLAAAGKGAAGSDLQATAPPLRRGSGGGPRPRGDRRRVGSAAWGKRASRSFRMVTSVSDAEVDYRRSSSARETLGGAAASRRK
ncbi:unnamed protein product [Spirodela intermedia]|uniref:Uncharacterized protein n=1 Tax=Spirodela intermedia TaxID=51605 RepID=A0A7I8JIF4_SPIIN|nr:unnamed protein product [Spirodela intermedia]CAA6669948.1 unnamed protein product [Spirodela intermedia]